MSTIFAKIIAKQIPATIVYEDERALAFKDIHPAAPFHALVIPKREVASIEAMSEDDAVAELRRNLPREPYRGT
mgnify:CR=1 FL=1